MWGGGGLGVGWMRVQAKGVLEGGREASLVSEGQLQEGQTPSCALHCRPHYLPRMMELLYVLSNLS